MRYILITILVFILMGASLEDARKANEAYNEGNYEEAITLYKKAIDEDPENAKLYFNLASAQAKAGNSEEAVRTFEQFKNMTDDEERRAMANYDIGNILAEQKQWDKAVEYYKKSLRYLSDDEDAKHNYELALKQQQNQKEQNQDQNQDQQQNQQNENDQQQDQNQQQKNNQQNQENNSQQNQDQQGQQGEQEQQGQQGEQEQNQDQQPQPRQSQMTQAEAEQILKALEQKEKELMKEFKKQKVESTDNKNEKDW